MFKGMVLIFLFNFILLQLKESDQSEHETPTVKLKYQAMVHVCPTQVPCLFVPFCYWIKFNKCFQVQVCFALYLLL